MEAKSDISPVSVLSPNPVWLRVRSLPDSSAWRSLTQNHPVLKGNGDGLAKCWARMLIRDIFVSVGHTTRTGYCRENACHCQEATPEGLW